MCPFCKAHDGKACLVSEKPNGRLACACGRHSWPSSSVFLETCRRASLTVTNNFFDYTQSH